MNLAEKPMKTEARAKRVRPTAKAPIVIQLITDGFEARDISATGAGIFVPPHLEGCTLKSPVKLVIQLPDSEPFRARGRIVHRTKIGREFLGVEFMQLPKAHATLIARYVERHLSESRQSGYTASTPQRQAS
jgi:c-di-GMP-binding flagellar brake protein YcgR